MDVRFQTATGSSGPEIRVSLASLLVSTVSAHRKSPKTTPNIEAGIVEPSFKNTSSR